MSESAPSQDEVAVQETPRTPFTGGKLTTAEFDQAYGVHSSLLTFDYLDQADEIPRLRQIREVGRFLTNRPKTCKHVTRTTLLGPSVLNHRVLNANIFDLDLICLLFGWWPVEREQSAASSFGTIFANPEYAHPTNQKHLPDPQYRRQVCQRAASIGLLTVTDLGRILGHDPQDVPQVVRETTGLDWATKYAHGNRRIARTFKTLVEWGHTTTEIARTFDLPPSGVRAQINQYASEFEPPPDPSYEAGLEAAQRKVIEEVRR